MKRWDYRRAGDFGLPLGKALRSVRREDGLLAGAMTQAWWLAARAYLRLWHRLVWQGREKLPSRRPFVIVANHCSHLDVFALASMLPMRHRLKTFPIAAGDTFFESPARTMFSALMLNALPLWRHRSSRHALDDLRDRLSQDECVYVVFPEGTRSRKGNMGRFKPGIGMLVAATEVPVVPCHIQGAFEALPPDRRLPRPRKVSVRVGDPLRFDDEDNSREGWNRIAATLQEQITALSR